MIAYILNLKIQRKEEKPRNYINYTCNHNHSFVNLDFMERRGSGIKKILIAYENDEKKPKF